MSLVAASGEYVSPHMSRLLALIAQTLNESDRLRLQADYDIAKKDSDLAHWVADHPLP